MLLFPAAPHHAKTLPGDPPGEIVVEFLEPIEASQYTLKERDVLNQKVHDVIAAELPPDQQPTARA